MLRDSAATKRFLVLAGVLAVLAATWIAPWVCLPVQAQTETAFTPDDKFDIPTNNSHIRFATNGTYTQAALENGTWVFQNLNINGSTSLPLFKASAQNSNMTITSYRKSEATFLSARVRYVVEGQGTQTVNFGPVPAAGELSIIYNNGTFMSEGQDWKATKDGTVTVIGAPDGTNVTVVYYVFLDYPSDYENQPFYQRHSVAIVTAVAVAATVALTGAVWYRNKLKETESSKLPHRRVLTENGKET